MTKYEYKVTYYHSAEPSLTSKTIGHFSIRFGDDLDAKDMDLSKTKIYGKHIQTNSKEGNIREDQERIYGAKKTDMSNLVAVTVTYYDEEKYKYVKKYVEDLADPKHPKKHAYNPLSNNCVDFVNEIHKMLGGGGTIGMKFSEEQYKKMKSEAGYQMKERFGMKDGFKVLTPLYNQEEKIARDYNVLVENVRYDGIKLKQDGFFHTQNSYTVIPPSNEIEEQNIPNRKYKIENTEAIQKYLQFIEVFNAEYGMINIEHNENGDLKISDREDANDQGAINLVDKYLEKINKMEESNLTEPEKRIGNYIKSYLLLTKSHHDKEFRPLEANKELVKIYNEIEDFFKVLREDQEELDLCEEKLNNEIQKIISALQTSRGNLFKYEKINGKTEEYWQKVAVAGEEVIKPQYKKMMEICQRYQEKSSRDECSSILIQKEYSGLVISSYGLTDSCNKAHWEYKDIAETLNDGYLCKSAKDQFSMFSNHLNKLAALGFNKAEMLGIVVNLLGLNEINTESGYVPIDKFPEGLEAVESHYGFTTSEDL